MCAYIIAIGMVIMASTMNNHLQAEVNITSQVFGDWHCDEPPTSKAMGVVQVGVYSCLSVTMSA